MTVDQLERPPLLDHHEFFGLTDSLPNGEVALDLARFEIYDVDAPVTKYVRGCLERLADPDNCPPVYVIKDDIPNAFTAREAIYVTDGLIDLFDAREEVLGVLAHELIHHEEEHVHRPAPPSVTSQAGQDRHFEIESDIKSFDRLDQRGINPAGCASALRKIKAYEDKHCQDQKDPDRLDPVRIPGIARRQPEPPKIIIHSLSHGSIEDRIVNLEQYLWVRDARHLQSTDSFQPIGLKRADFGSTYSDELGPDMPADPSIQQALILRAARADLDAKRELSAPVIEAEATILQTHNPDLSKTDAQNMAAAILHIGNKPSRSTPSLDTLLDLLPHIANLTLPIPANSLKEHFQAEAERLVQDQFYTLLEQNNLTTVIDTLQTHLGPTIGHKSLLAHMWQMAANDPRANAVCELIATMPLKSTEIADAYLRFDKAGSMDYTAHIATAFRRLREIDTNRHRQAMQMLEDQATLPLLTFLATRSQFLSHVTDGDKNTFLHDLDYWGAGLSANVKIGLTYDAQFDTIELESGISYEDETDLYMAGAEGFGNTAAIIGRMAAGSLTKDPTNLFGQKLRAHLAGLDHLTLLQQIHTRLEPGERAAVLSLLRHLRLSPVPGDQTETRKNLMIDIITGDQEAFPEAFARFTALLKEGAQPSLMQIRTKLTELKYLYQKLGKHHELPHSLAELVSGCEQAKDYLLIDCLGRVNSLLERPGHTADFLQPLRELVQHFPVAQIRTSNYLAGNEQAIWGKAVDRFMDLVGEEAALGDLSTDQLYGLLALSLMSTDLHVGISLPGHCVTELARRLDFDAAFELVFNQLQHLPPVALTEAIEYLVEEKAETFEQLARFESVATERLAKLVEDNYSSLGLAAVFDSYIVETYKGMKDVKRTSALRSDRIEGLQPTELLTAMLKTAQDPRDLQVYIFDRWWTGHRLGAREELKNFFNIEDYIFVRYQQPNKLKYWINNEAPDENFVSLDNLITKAYLPNAPARYAALRKLLLGDNGILTTEQGRQDLISALKNSWLSIVDNDEVAQMIDGILQALVSTQSPEDLYQYIAPVLQELILRPPVEQADYKWLADLKAQEILDDLAQRKDTTFTAQDVANVSARILRMMDGQTRPPQAQRIGNDDEYLHTTTNQRLMRFTDPPESGEIQQLSPIQLAILLGKKSGAIGARMLQLGGQYYPIPPEDQPAFRDIYDQMRGQSRFQAYKLLKREARYVPEIAQLLSEIKVFGRRIGGGSLVTVYEIETRSGDREVLGIRNPNAAHHVARIATIADSTLAAAIEAEPDNVDLRLSRLLVYDAVDWINHELNDTDFDRKDTVFRQQLTDPEQSIIPPGRSRYLLHVPLTKPTGTLWVRREQFIDGHNLNGLEIADQTNIAAGQISAADYQDVVSLLSRSFAAQMLKGDYVHPDLHPGNFRITTDNQTLALLDRYNLIPITPDLRRSIKATVRTLLSGDVTSALQNFISLSGGEVGGTILDALSGEIQTSTDTTQAIIKSIVTLRKQGLTMPLELSLIVRNIFALFGLAQQAGFNNLLEAFNHTAAPAELAELLQLLQ